MSRFTTGKVYYPAEFRRMLKPELLPPSLIERATDFYFSRLWPARLLLGIGLVLISATIGLIIVGCL